MPTDRPRNDGAPPDSHLEAVEFERVLRRNHPWLWWGTLIGPFAITAVLLAVLWLLRGTGYVRLLAGTAFATFFFFGRFVILGGETQNDAPGRFFDAETLMLMVIYMDVMTASLIAFHAGFLWRLPLIGRRIQVLAEEGRILAANAPWVRRTTFLGIVAFVMFPLASTGSIGGSLFGRLLGMGRMRTFVAVVLGSLLGCGVMYYGASLIDRYLDRSNPVVTFAGVVVIVGVILLLTIRFRRLTARRETEDVLPPESSR